MEGGIKDERHFLIGHDRTAGVNALDRRRIVQRRKLRDLIHRFHDLVGDERRLLECLARSDNAVTYGVDLVHRLDDARLAVDELVQDKLNGFGVIRDLLLDNKGLAQRLMRETAALDPDALDVALCEDFLRLDVDELIFQRRTACVDDQNFHVVLLRKV